MLILISILHCAYLLAAFALLLLKFDSNSIDIKLLPVFSNFYYSSSLILSVITLICFILLITVFFFQVKFICSNETTSENIRRSPHGKNPYNRGCRQNIKEFFNNNEGYKEMVTYNEAARDYLMTVCLITEYFAMVERKSFKNRTSVVSQAKTDKDYFNTSDASIRTSEKMLQVEPVESKC